MSLILKKGKFRVDNQSLDMYLRDIAKTPLISAEEEVALARKVKLGEKRALQKLTKVNLRFVVSVAKQYQNQGVELSDLINEGNIGLMKAAKRFDGERGFKFISYAVWWVRQAILQALAEQSRIVRLPMNRVDTLRKIGKVSARLEQKFGYEPSDEEIAQALGLTAEEVRETRRIASTHLSLDAPFNKSPGTEEGNSLLDIISDELQIPPDNGYNTLSLREKIVRVLDTLAPREAEVIDLYFNLTGFGPLTLEEIGMKFGLTRERIRQIKWKAIARLRQSMLRQLAPGEQPASFKQAIKAPKSIAPRPHKSHYLVVNKHSNSINSSRLSQPEKQEICDEIEALRKREKDFRPEDWLAFVCYYGLNRQKPLTLIKAGEKVRNTSFVFEAKERITWQLAGKNKADYYVLRKKLLLYRGMRLKS